MVRLSTDEIIATTKHTSLPTVFVEGEDDMYIFNRIEETLGSLRANVLPCGDKNTLLGVFSRRAEFCSVPTCFVADRDMWFFSGVPLELADVVFTTGYSIENDLYSDSNIERILTVQERQNHAVLVAEVCKWFAFEVDKYLKGQDFRADPKLARLIPTPGFTCCPIYLLELGFQEPPDPIFQRVLGGYKLSLRGKLLYEVIVRFTHTRGRPGGSYRYQNLMELSVVDGLKGPLIGRIISDIRLKLGILPEPQPNLPFS